METPKERKTGTKRNAQNQIPSTRRRKKLFVQRKGDSESNPQGEWMVDLFFQPKDKAKLIADTVKAIGLDSEKCSVWIPGIGHSHIALMLLRDHNFHNITCTDIHDGSIEYQRKILQEFKGKCTVQKDDLLANIETKSSVTFDLIIDSSVSDVFFAGGGIQLAQKNIRSKMSTSSAMIILSMNHRLWPAYLKKCCDSFFYSSIKQFSGNRRNPKNMRRDVAYIVAVKGVTLVNDLPTHDLMVKQNERGSKWLQNPTSSMMQCTPGECRQ